MIDKNLYKCLQGVKPGDTIRFLNSKLQDKLEWAIQQKASYRWRLGRNELMYFDAVPVSLDMKYAYLKNALGGHFMSLFDLGEGFKSSPLISLYRDGLIAYWSYDVNLIKQLYESGYKFSFYYIFTNFEFFIPVKITKRKLTQY